MSMNTFVSFTVYQLTRWRREMVIINKRILRKEMIDGFQDFYSYHFLDNVNSVTTQCFNKSRYNPFYMKFLCSTRLLRPNSGRNTDNTLAV